MVMDLVLTRQIQNAIIGALKSDQISKELAERLSPFAQKALYEEESNEGGEKASIPFNLVKRLWECIRADSSSNVYLHELISGSDVYVEPLRSPEKSPELVARLNKLKAQQEKADYDRMVSNVERKWDQSDSMQLGHEVRSGSKQLASVINFILSLVGTFAFGYIASQYAFPSVAVRVIIGVLLAFIVAIAELYFMARVEI